MSGRAAWPSRSFIGIVLVASLGLRCNAFHEEMNERDLLNMIHERPPLAGRMITSILSEPHSAKIVAEQLRKNPREAGQLLDMMLADRDLGTLIRERCAKAAFPPTALIDGKKPLSGNLAKKEESP